MYMYSLEYVRNILWNIFIRMNIPECMQECTWIIHGIYVTVHGIYMEYIYSAVHPRCILDLEYTFNLGAVHSEVYS